MGLNLAMIRFIPKNTIFDKTQQDFLPKNNESCEYDWWSKTFCQVVTVFYLFCSSCVYDNSNKILVCATSQNKSRRNAMLFVSS